MVTFIKKTAQVDAVQVVEGRTEDRPQWLIDAIKRGTVYWSGGDRPYYTVQISSHQTQRAYVGDWIVFDREGQVFVIDDGYLKAMYDAVDPTLRDLVDRPWVNAKPTLPKQAPVTAQSLRDPFDPIRFLVQQQAAQDMASGGLNPDKSFEQCAREIENAWAFLRALVHAVEASGFAIYVGPGRGDCTIAPRSEAAST